MGAATGICYVTADPDVEESVGEALEATHSRFRVETATSVETAVDRLQAVDWIVSDHDPPEIDAIDVLEAVRAVDPEMPFVVATANGSEQLASEAVSAGVTEYISQTSSDDGETLASRLSEVIERAGRERQTDTDWALREIAAQTDDVLFVVDADWETLRFVNGAYEDIFAGSIADLRADPASIVTQIHPDDRETVHRAMGRLSAGTAATVECQVYGPEGTVRWIRAEGKPVFDDGTVSEIVGFVRDITEQVERTRRLETLISNVPGIVYRCRNDPDWPMEYAKGECEATTGYTATELESDTLVWGEDVIHPADQERAWETVQDELAADGRFELTYRIQTQGGETKWMWERGQLVERRDAADTLEGFITDITERREQKEELAELNTLLSTLFETLPVGVTVLDDDGNITRANEHAEAVLGLDESEIIGRTYDDPEWEIIDADGNEIPPEDLPFARVIASGEPSYDYRHGIRWPDGSVHWLSINAAPLATDPDDIQEVVTVISDITEQLENERALTRQNERLEEFASVLSHDLRNPLNVASGHLELLAKADDSEHVAAIETAHERMKTLIEKMLLLAREGDRISETEPVSLRSLIENCWQTVDTPGARLRVSIDRSVTADRNRLRQLLENLIRNAIEHGADPAGTVARDGDDTPAVTVQIGPLDGGFYVEDDGPGIPPDEREAVFETSYSTQDNGTGFGLSIARRVAEAHGWAIRVTESQAGGARFEITGVEFVD
ncbi:PAS domain S-box protein [Halorhabdus sp. CUG00001]|uniref:hybrid sensor histidine kinase/response regulator n=1 Tax=Halorhabdus sp. CUG00001 TaxID=2600297 RepID=UPI00131BF38C|nr:PAS domain S-box protein [Halorhabdus sp. CUG00001]